MGNTITRIIEGSINRRAFLVKLTTVTGAFISGLLGAPKAAYACACCSLCRNPQQCSWNENICDCIWCWTCEVRADCKIYKCKECLVLPFAAGCTTSNCACHNNNSLDSCRYCDEPARVPCSRTEYFGAIPNCVKP